MTEHQLEAHFIFAIVSIGSLVVAFLIAVIASFRAKNKRKAIAEEILNHTHRKNGKHLDYGKESENKKG